MKRIKISQEELNQKLSKHALWLSNKEEGEKLDLSNIDLRSIDLRNTNLSHVNFYNADLNRANLRDANLKNANLEEANLFHANLFNANLKEAYLFNADLRGTNLSRVNFHNADLSYADLRGANLRSAYLIKANMEKIDYNEATAFFALQCPEEGSFIGYKKSSDKIVKLLILEDSLRSSATTRKCRASKVKVIDITSLDGKTFYEESINEGSYAFTYKVGETYEIEDFDKDRWRECASGIHFFITRQEAINY